MPAKQIHLLLLVIGFNGTLPAQTPPSSASKSVMGGEITRFDKLKNGFELTSRKESENLPNIRSGGIRVGGGGEATATRSSGNVRPTDPSRKDPSVVPDDTIRDVVFKITTYLSDETVCREGTKILLCAEIKVGDHVTVTGDEKIGIRGRGLYATQIVRTQFGSRSTPGR